MGALNKYLNELYFDIIKNSPEIISMDIPADIGQGAIYQIKTKRGVVISDWHMQYDVDAHVRGVNNSEYMQMIFCMNEGVTWESCGKTSLMDMAKGDSCIYRCTDQTEHICYSKNRDFRFKQMRIPVKYLNKILSEYFESREQRLIEQKLYTEFSKTRITAHMERVLIEMMDSTRYIGGLGYLYLESKSLELISVYLRELLNLNNAQKNISLSKSDQEAIVEAKRIIDNKIPIAPSCEELCKLVHLSMTKLTKGFSHMFGMPVHTYIIEQRLMKAAHLLVENDMNIGQIAAAVGYSKASNFSRAFEKKYGMLPKRYRNSWIPG